MGASDGADGGAFVWDAAHGMRCLSDVLAAAGVDTAGWRLGIARDISADGRVIVRAGLNPLGQNEAFMAIIPEPGAATLFAMSLLALLRRLRRSRRRARGGLEAS